MTATAQESPAPAIEVKDLDLRKVWFLPAPAKDADPICGALTTDVRQQFRSATTWPHYVNSGLDHLGLTRAVPSEDSADGLRRSATDPNQLILEVPGQQRLFLYFENLPGATQRVSVATRVGAADTATPPAEAWTLYRTASGTWYAAGVVADHLQVYAVTATPDWRLACDVALAPYRLRASSDPAVKEALLAVDALELAVRGLSRPRTAAGALGTEACTSVETGARWNERVHQSLETALYRPWQLTPDRAAAAPNSHGDYPRIAQSLSDWSLTGQLEHEAFAHYEKQLTAASAVLQRFYVQKFGWSTQTAGRMARQALTTSISHGFGFTAYQPFASPQERQLRAAIFQRQPLDQLRAIEMTPAVRDAVLDIAVQHPPALRYLLAQGANPNVVNPFGKTPLMYAAQYNALVAAQLLLEQGADPNAATNWPSDHCAYSLSTARVTPLHYAVRYGSAELVELLLRNGALPYARTLVKGQDGGYPLDWLQRYTAVDAPERNANLADADRSQLATLLRIPTDAERTELAREWVARADSDAAAGNPEAAYRSLRAALQAQSTNSRALGELPEAALQSGYIGVALQAANAVLDSQSAPEVQARAWSTIAHACQQAGRAFTYDDHRYCTTSIIEPLLQAWQLQPSPVRKDQLQALFEDDGLRTCNVPAPKKTRQRYHFAPPRIYVYHARTQTIDPDTVQWQTTRGTTHHPRLLQRHEVGADVITVLEAQDLAMPVKVGPHVCR